MEKRKYDLRDRAIKFSTAIIQFSQQIFTTPITLPLVAQLVKSATSVGANLCEADCAETKKDFIHKMGICNKEAKETIYWLHTIGNVLPDWKSKTEILLSEATELQLILAAIIRTAKSNEDKKAAVRRR